VHRPGKQQSSEDGSTIHLPSHSSSTVAHATTATDAVQQMAVYLFIVRPEQEDQADDNDQFGPGDDREGYVHAHDSNTGAYCSGVSKNSCAGSDGLRQVDAIAARHSLPARPPYAAGSTSST
jgi:hypothetical protein